MNRSKSSLLTLMGEYMRCLHFYIEHSRFGIPTLLILSTIFEVTLKFTKIFGIIDCFCIIALWINQIFDYYSQKNEKNPVQGNDNKSSYYHYNILLFSNMFRF